ncbi:MAG: DUF4392 domain-containing protein [Oscillospiraceae bacterium]|jgi:hypothetical protein|nr:DUF4392 domain-containing protein [Oscillospiraceae bacterium]
MTQAELTDRNVGQNLDDLMNLDPRGYGICRILYPAARKLAREPLSIRFAKRLMAAAGEGDIVYILTGFVLPPHRCAETDGIIGSSLFARALVLALGAKPVLIVPEECVNAAQKLAAAVGLHAYDTVEEARAYPYSEAILPFTRDASKAEERAEQILSMGKPAALVSSEAAGANSMGLYHNAGGIDVTDLEAKSDALYRLAQRTGIPTFSIGDLGNEMGMGAIADHLDRWIPRAARGFGERSIAADTSADILLTATVSDWGMNAVIAALAYLKEDPDILHSAELQKDAMVAASRAGMVNMYGDLNPAIDGFDVDFNQTVLHLMRRCIESALKLRATCAPWFDAVRQAGYYEEYIE